MKKYLASLCIVLVGFCACSFEGEHIEPLSEQEVSQVMDSYYKQPDADKFIRMLAYFDDTEFLQTHKTAVAPVEGMLAGLAVNNASEWKTVTQEVVWEKNMIPVMQAMPNRIAMLKHILASNSAVAQEAAALDFLWGAFLATCDPKFEIIIRTKNNPSVDPIVRSAALWSLYAQRAPHPAVQQLLDQAPSAPDKFMQQLEEKITSAK